MQIKDEKKRAILTATKALISEYGQDFTMESVAKAAGVSKGGLLYYFPTKVSLINGLLTRIHDEFIQRITQEALLREGEAGAWTQATITVLSADILNESLLNVSARATLMLDDVSLTHIRQDYEDLQQHFEEDGLDPIDATIVRLALEGLYHSKWFRIAPIDQAKTQAVIDRLWKITEKKKEE